MPILQGLQFTAMERTSADPTLNRRARLVAQLLDQKALLADPKHARTREKWTKVDGVRKAEQHVQRVRPWWKVESTGKVVMALYAGGKPIEFEKGRSAIAVAKLEDLPAIVDKLIAAVRAGELDNRLVGRPVTKSLPKGKSAA